MDGKDPGRVGYYDQVSGVQGEEPSLSELTAQEGFRLVTEAKLISLEGQAGRFAVRYLDGEDRVQEEAVGAVLIALAPEVKANFEAFGLKPSRRVLSLGQLETLLSSPEYREKLIPPGEPTEIVFLSGLTAESGPPVLARALRDARKIQGLENTQVYFLSGNLKVAAEGLEREYTRAREEGVIFFRFTGQLPVVKAAEADLQVEFFDEIIDRSLILNPQVIVVDEDLLPHPWLKELSPVLETPLDSKGFMAPDQVYALPVRAPRPGIYVVGGSRRPFPSPEEIRGRGGGSGPLRRGIDRPRGSGGGVAGPDRPQEVHHLPDVRPFLSPSGHAFCSSPASGPSLGLSGLRGLRGRMSHGRHPDQGFSGCRRTPGDLREFYGPEV